MSSLKIMILVGLGQLPMNSIQAQENISTSVYVQRLYRHVHFLRTINTQLKRPVIVVDGMPTTCKHELMQWCIKKIHDEGRINSLFDVWHAFTQHTVDACTDDALFIRDFAALIYVIYMNIVSMAVRADVQDFITLYNQVSALPLSDILDLLDLFFDKLGVVFQAYSTSTFSYVDLIKQYWWAPCAVLAAIGTSVLQWYNRRYSSIVT